MAADLEKTLAQSRSRDQDLSIEDGQLCKFFQNGGKESGYDNCQQTKWSTKGEPKAVKFDVRNQNYGWMNARATRMR